MTGAQEQLDAVMATPDPRLAAELAAEALRVVNRLTLSAPSPGTPAWEETGDLLRLLGELCVLAERLPQTLGQLARHLERPTDDGRCRSDSGACESPEALVANSVAALQVAGERAHQLGAELGVARSAVAHLSV